LIFGGENILTTDRTIGQRITIRGRVLDGDGKPVPDAMVEIWQADAHGLFNHPADPNQAQADRAFRGFGRSGTSEIGEFWFKTVKPGRVVWEGDQQQAPHVNIYVFARGMLIHAITRLYFSDEPSNDADPVLNLVPAERRHTLIAALERSEDLPCYCFDIRLQGEDETVFFNP
jgi:protocatechuate 3,4-dioxygenase alpha subunit